LLERVRCLPSQRSHARRNALAGIFAFCSMEDLILPQVYQLLRVVMPWRAFLLFARGREGRAGRQKGGWS